MTRTPKFFWRAALLGLAAVAVTIGAFRPGETVSEADAAGTLPQGWPTTLQVGMMDSPGGAAAMRATAPYGFRYQYLAAGVNTGNGWANWNPNGQFVTYYIEDSVAASITPVFTYYQIFMSLPGSSGGEMDAVLANLQNDSTMVAYWNDLKLFFQRAGAFPDNKVVLHVEPDMWGYVHQRATGDNATTVGARVGGTGIAELAGLPDNMGGFAKAVVRLRDTYAPNVVLGYHMSIWGTGVDIQWSQTDNPTTDALATRAGNFYNSLGANFDITFAEFSDRDSGFKQVINGLGTTLWFDAEDFARHARFLKTFSNTVQKRVVLWQIPLGNTKMLAMNNTWNHFQDNRVEWLFDDPSRSHLSTYIDAGVVAFLFGRGADGATCACDAAYDGVTNPAPINGNTSPSLNADDDGGFFKQKAAAYYAQGAMPLSGGSPPSTSTPAPSTTATMTPTNTPTPATPTATARVATPTATTTTPTATTTATPAAGLAWTTSATTSAATVDRGTSITIAANVRASQAALALVDVEVYNTDGEKIYQRYWDGQSFKKNRTRTFRTTWQVPANLAPGVYTVKIGVFNPGWGVMHHWNNGARTFTVR